MVTPIIHGEKSTRSLTEFEFNKDSDSSKAKLGKGSFANVQLVKEKRSGKLFALKMINVSLSEASQSDLYNLQTEIKIHRTLNHPNIIKFYDYIQEGQNVYLVLDYAPKGNLYGHIYKRILPMNQVFRYFYQTCLAIQYLHEKDVLHRDIKPENLLLDQDLNVKLCDFGWAARSIHEKRTTFCGTYEYMAPEIVEKKPYDYRVDIWSLGVLLYELSHGEPPYKGRSLPEITSSLIANNVQFHPSIQPDLKDLILRILKMNPNERLSVKEILSHPWVRSNIEPAKSSQSTGESLYYPRVLKEEASLLNRQSGNVQVSYQPLDKENHKKKSYISQENLFKVTPTIQSVNSPSNSAFVSYSSNPNPKRRWEAIENSVGILGYRELNQERPLPDRSQITSSKPLNGSYYPNKVIEPPTIELFRSLSDETVPGGTKLPSDSNLRAQPLKINLREAASRSASIDEVQYKKIESPMSAVNSKLYNNQRTYELLKKAESSRLYYYKTNYLQQPTFSESPYSSNLSAITSPKGEFKYNIDTFGSAINPQYPHSNQQTAASLNELWSDEESLSIGKNYSSRMEIKSEKQIPYSPSSSLLYSQPHLYFSSDKSNIGSIKSYSSLPPVAENQAEDRYRRDYKQVFFGVRSQNELPFQSSNPSAYATTVPTSLNERQLVFY